MSMVPGGTVQTEALSANQKEVGTRSNSLRNARWNLDLSDVICPTSFVVICRANDVGQMSLLVGSLKL